MVTGGCLCGAVRYQLNGELRPVVACHCSQCRRTSGHYWAATHVPLAQFKLTKETGLKWFQSSAHARRGFCQACGASLFWEKQGEGAVSIGAGTLDEADDLGLSLHIYVKDKPGYYDIEEGPEQRQKY